PSPGSSSLQDAPSQQHDGGRPAGATAHPAFERPEWHETSRIHSSGSYSPSRRCDSRACRGAGPSVTGGGRRAALPLYQGEGCQHGQPCFAFLLRQKVYQGSFDTQKVPDLLFRNHTRGMVCSAAADAFCSSEAWRIAGQSLAATQQCSSSKKETTPLTSN